MKIKAGKKVFEVVFFAISLFFDRGCWTFTLPTIRVYRDLGLVVIYFYAFLWNAGITIKKDEE